jgi:glycosyltransferase involved in cell wall biosynthesis
LAEHAPRRDVVLLYGPPWTDAARFSKHHLALYLAGAGRRVLYVEAPLGPLTLVKRRSAARRELQTTQQLPRQVAPGLWARRYFNPIPYHSVSWVTERRLVNRLGQALIARWLKRDLQRLGFREPLLIAGLPHAADLVPLVPSSAVIYHCADDYARVHGFPSTLGELEQALCRDADLVVTTAETLYESRRVYNPWTVWIPNGVEVDHFAQPVEPAGDVPIWEGPVVGFVGTIGQWVDLDLLARLAHARPDVLLLLVGPTSKDLGPLRTLHNVTWLGPRPYTDVPRYLAAMDVALIPFTRDEVTRNADPIKVYEYLASGVPVVATDLPALQRFQDVIALAGSSDEMVALVSRQLERGRTVGIEERQAEARKHSWQARFSQLDEMLTDLEARCAS